MKDYNSGFKSLDKFINKNFIENSNGTTNYEFFLENSELSQRVKDNIKNIVSRNLIKEEFKVNEIKLSRFLGSIELLRPELESNKELGEALNILNKYEEIVRKRYLDNEKLVGKDLYQKLEVYGFDLDEFSIMENKNGKEFLIEVLNNIEVYKFICVSNKGILEFGKMSNGLEKIKKFKQIYPSLDSKFYFYPSYFTSIFLASDWEHKLEYLISNQGKNIEDGLTLFGYSNWREIFENYSNKENIKYFLDNGLTRKQIIYIYKNRDFKEKIRKSVDEDIIMKISKFNFTNSQIINFIVSDNLDENINFINNEEKIKKFIDLGFSIANIGRILVIKDSYKIIDFLFKDNFIENINYIKFNDGFIVNFLIGKNWKEKLNYISDKSNYDKLFEFGISNSLIYSLLGSNSWKEKIELLEDESLKILIDNNVLTKNSISNLLKQIDFKKKISYLVTNIDFLNRFKQKELINILAKTNWKDILNPIIEGQKINFNKKLLKNEKKLFGFVNNDNQNKEELKIEKSGVSDNIKDEKIVVDTGLSESREVSNQEIEKAFEKGDFEEVTRLLSLSK